MRPLNASASQSFGMSLGGYLNEFVNCGYAYLFSINLVVLPSPTSFACLVSQQHHVT